MGEIFTSNIFPTSLLETVIECGTQSDDGMKFRNSFFNFLLFCGGAYEKEKNRYSLC